MLFITGLRLTTQARSSYEVDVALNAAAQAKAEISAAAQGLQHGTVLLPCGSAVAFEPAIV
jgi:hypothetical protein